MASGLPHYINQLLGISLELFGFLSRIRIYVLDNFRHLRALGDTKWTGTQDQNSEFATEHGPSVGMAGSRAISQGM